MSAWTKWRARLSRYRWVGIAVSLPLVAGAILYFVAVRWSDYPSDRLRPATVASQTVLDRAGDILRQGASVAGGRQSWVPLSEISPHLRNATIAAEDRRFASHAGVDWWAMLRAVGLNLRARRFAFGGSTITMQLCRLLEPQQHRGSLDRLSWKLQELVVAGRLERTLNKDEILEQYLNRVYYGNGATGAEAAARLYFDKPVRLLSVGEAALLAVLPRNPTRYNPFGHLRRTLNRRARVMALMVEQGRLSQQQRQLAARTPLRIGRQRPGFRAPHFVELALARLPASLRRGVTLRTTLDGPLQRQLEVALRRHLADVASLNISQAALVILRNSDGAILSLIGSRDYFDAQHDGAFNATTSRLRPGSTLKPFIYALAIEQGDTAASIAYDIVQPHEVHEAHSKEVRQHGIARYREALAGSYNLAAVHTLQRVGVPAALQRLRRAGLSTLDWPDRRYDQQLAIGEAEVRLLDLAAAFSCFGRGGVAVRPRAIIEAERRGVITKQPSWRPPTQPLQRIYSPQVAHVLFDILSDPDARRPMFGDRVPLQLPFPVALKTGTTRAYTDNWAFGTTREYTVGVWAGNFDGKPTHGVMSMRGATPLLRAAFSALAARFGPPSAPPRPPGLTMAKVCPLSGQRPGPHCPRRKRELFIAGSEPTKRCSWHVQRCGIAYTRYPPEARPWLRARGLLPSPPRCPGVAGTPPLRILYPTDGARFALDPFRPAGHQLPPLRAEPTALASAIRWSIDGTPASRWIPRAGEHRVRASLGNQRVEVTIHFEQ